MINPQQPEDIAADNESSLKALVRAIALSQGEFSLILVLCNYAVLQERMVQRLRELASVKIRELVLPSDVKTLFTTIQKTLAEEQPPALMVFGLDSVSEIDTVLTSTNYVREEFRNNFPFPLVLWVTDEVLQKLIRLVPDFESWATTVMFAIATEELIHLIQQTTDEVFAKVLDAGAGIFLNNSALNLETGSRCRAELNSAGYELQRRGVKLRPELKASLEFVLGRVANNLSQSRQHYEQSLALWQQSSNLQRQGCLLYCLGLSWRTYAVQPRVEPESAYRQAKDYFEKCIQTFEQANCPELVAKFINALGEVLQRLEQWDELEKFAEKALNLHQRYSDSFRLARVYGFQAEVALANEDWTKAQQFAQQALSIQESAFPDASISMSSEESAKLDWERSFHRGWYLFSLARSQQKLNQSNDAIQNLETARASTKPEYDPELYIRILEELRNSYFKRRQYLTAFQIKQERRLIEVKFGFSAFIGIRRLQPKQQVTNPALPDVEHQETGVQEIAASGRHQDIDRLVERMNQNKYKLTIIHGQSGVGKSSILQAGLVPALKQKAIATREVIPVLQQVYSDWVGELGERLTKALEEVRTISLSANIDSTAAILNQLRKNADNNLLTVLIFSQFEEFFFVYKELNQRQIFYEFLRDCLNTPYVKVILSLREDYLSYLLECDRLVYLEVLNKNILHKDNLYYLGNFSTEDTKSVIERLTQRAFYLEPPLIDQLVRDLAGNLGEVRPIELQVVGAQLQTDNITTLAKYEEHGPKPKEKLVKQFLDEVIADCGSEKERDTALLVLYLLTEENGTRPLKSRAELAAILANVEADKLDSVLAILVESGLVFLTPEKPGRYQLIHDYFVSFIRQQRAAELLKQLKKAEEQNKINQEKINLNQKKLKRSLRVATFAAVVAAVAAVVAAVAAYSAHEQTKIAKEGEIKALTASSKLLFDSNQEFDALIEGLRARHQLQPQLNTVEDDIRIGVVDAVRQAVYGVRERNRLEEHTDWVTSVSFSPDGQTIASASSDKTIKLWKRDGEKIQTSIPMKDEHKGQVTSVSFSPKDGKTIATASLDGTVKLWIWDGKKLNWIKTLKGEKNELFWSVSFSTDGETIATASEDAIASKDGAVKLWKRKGKQSTPIATLKGHKGGAFSVSFSPDGKTIATASGDGTVKLWKRNGEEIKTSIPMKDQHTDRVYSVSFSPKDGKTIATASWDKTIKLWSWDGKEIKPIRTLEGYNDRFYGVSFSPDGKTIAATSGDKTIKLWNQNDTTWEGDGTLPTTTLTGHEGRVYGVSFSPKDGKTIATASEDKTVRLWSLDNSLLSTLQGHTGEIYSVSFSQDSQTIATASADKTVKLWSRDGTLLKTLEGHSEPVWNASFSPVDNKTIASASWDGTVKLWKPDGKENKPREILKHTDKVFSVSFSRNGQTIASVGSDTKIRLWSQDGKESKPWDSRHTRNVVDVSFSPVDDKIIATASDDGTAKLWKREGENFIRVKTLKSHKDEVNGVSFSPDGKMIATASDDGSAILWNQNGVFIRKLEEHEDRVISVSFSPDSQTIATASFDKTIKLWNVNDGKLLQTLPKHDNWVWDASFSPDGKILASVSSDKTARLWHLDKTTQRLFELDELLKRGCNWLGDYLQNNSKLEDSDRHLQNNPKLKESDRHLCDGIGTQK